MDAKAVGVGAALVVTLAVVAALFVGGLGGTTTVTFDDDPFDPELIDDTPVVVAVHESGGFSLFGVQISGPDRWLSVGVAPPAECIGPDERGDELLLGDDGCDQYASLAGPVRGGGVTSHGLRWVEVTVDASRACFDAATVGDRWPPPDGVCG